MDGDDTQSSEARSVFEEIHGDQGVLCDPGLAIHEGDDHNAADYEERDDFGRVPREDGTAEVEAQEDHQCEGEEREHAGPIDCADAIDEGCVLMLNVEEKDNKNGSDTADGQIDVDYDLSVVSSCYNGSRRDLQHQRHDTSEAKTPPKIGPTPPAIAQIPSVKPMMSPRTLSLSVRIPQ